MSDLTLKQEGFVKDYLETGNATRAVLNNYDISTEGKTKEQIENTAAAIGSENLRKAKIQEYLQSRAEKAAEVVYTLAISAENETVRLNASKDILDRAGHKPVERTDVTSGDKPLPILNAIFPNNINQENTGAQEEN